MLFNKKHELIIDTDWSVYDQAYKVITGFKKADPLCSSNISIRFADGISLNYYTNCLSQVSYLLEELEIKTLHFYESQLEYI